MDRLAALLGDLELPELSRMLRRTVYASVGVGVVALGVLVLVGYPLVGLGICIGLGLGLVNIRLVMATVSKLNASGQAKIKGPMAMNTLVRLGLTTVVALGLILVLLQLGMGVLGGIAAFYFLFLLSLLRSLLQQ